jgi:hypothetical protein
MGTSPAAVLARIKVQHGTWSIRKIEPGDGPPTYRAERNGQVIHAATLGDLERQLGSRNGDA